MTVLRLLVAVAALPAALRVRPAAPGPAPAPEEPEPLPAPARSLRVARAVLVGAGALLTGVALGLVAAGVPARQWGGIVLWLASALVLHDAVLAPLLLVAGRLLRRTSRTLPWGTVAVVEVVLVVAGLLTLLVFPALRAQAIGPRNPSVLPFDYAANLAVVWALGSAVVVAAVLAGALRRR